MKILLYANRNVGLIALSYLVGEKHDVSVISDGDQNMFWLAGSLGCRILNLDVDWGEPDLFICVHGRKIIPKEKLVTGKFVNIHPCLFKYKGHNPIKRYIENKDTLASVESHYMTPIVDEGEVIHQEFFYTQEITNYEQFYDAAMVVYFKCLSETLNKITR